MLPTSAGVEPATSWYPVERRILLRNGIGKSIFYELRQYRAGRRGGVTKIAGAPLSTQVQGKK